MTAILLSISTLSSGIVSTGLPMIAYAKSNQGDDTQPTAGVIATLGSFQASALATDIQVNANLVATVSANAGTSAVDQEWVDKLMINGDENVNVREAASEESQQVGILRKGDLATFTSLENGWYAITSGNVNGYIKADYVVTGEEAETLADSLYAPAATANTDGLRIRNAASADAAILDALNQGQSLKVKSDAEVVDGWVAVEWNGMTGYVNAEYVTVGVNYTSGMTMEELAAQIAAEEAARKAAEEAAAKKAAEEAAAKQAAEAKKAATTNAATSASADDRTMLAAIASLEAGSYDGQVAVAAVVLNRVRSGAYPSSISGVITQRGQFTTASRLNAIISRGVSSQALSAADAALAGSDPTGGCLSFRAASSGHAGTNIGGNVFF